MQDELRIHITPSDTLADIDEVPDGLEPRSRCKLYIVPYGRHEINEVNEANYYVGNKVPYHEHTTGYETFLVDGGAIEVMARSRKAVARKGDFVHIQPYSPHSIHCLEDNSIWRAFHQGHSLVVNMVAQDRLRKTYPELTKAPNFRQEISTREHTSEWFDYGFPECEEVPASELPEIRTFDEALAEFDFDKLKLKLKIGKWETGGAKEVWQLHMKAGCSFSWIPLNLFPLLYDVYDGAVEVKLDGMDAFTANTRDLLHIPKFLGGSITALEDTVLLDTGCQGNMMRYLDEVNAIRAREPDKLKDAEYLHQLMKKYDFYVQYQF